MENNRNKTNEKGKKTGWIVAAVLIVALCVIGSGVYLYKGSENGDVTYLSGGSGSEKNAAAENADGTETGTLDEAAVDYDGEELTDVVTDVLNPFTVEGLDSDPQETVEDISADVTETEVAELPLDENPEPVTEDGDASETVLVTDIQTISSACAEQTITAGDDISKISLPDQVSVALETQSVFDRTTITTTYETRQREVTNTDNETDTDTSATDESSTKTENASDTSTVAGEEDELTGASGDTASVSGDTEKDAEEVITDTEPEYEDYYVEITTTQVQRVTRSSVTLGTVDVIWNEDGEAVDTQTPGEYYLTPEVFEWPDQAETADGISAASIGTVKVTVTAAEDMLDASFEEDETVGASVTQTETTDSGSGNSSSLTLSDSELEFIDTPVGYNSTDTSGITGSSLVQTISITNKTSKQINLFYDSASGSDYILTEDNFRLTFTGSSVLAANGESGDTIDVKVQPVNGLSAGTYDTDLYIKDSSENTIGTIRVFLTVTAFESQYNISVAYNNAAGTGYESGSADVTVSLDYDANLIGDDWKLTEVYVNANKVWRPADKQFSAELLDGENVISCKVTDLKFGTVTSVAKTLEGVTEVDNPFTLSMSNVDLGSVYGKLDTYSLHYGMDTSEIYNYNAVSLYLTNNTNKTVYVKQSDLYKQTDNTLSYDKNVAGSGTWFYCFGNKNDSKICQQGIHFGFAGTSTSEIEIGAGKSVEICKVQAAVNMSAVNDAVARRDEETVGVVGGGDITVNSDYAVNVPVRNSSGSVLGSCDFTCSLTVRDPGTNRSSKTGPYVSYALTDSSGTATVSTDTSGRQMIVLGELTDGYTDEYAKKLTSAISMTVEAEDGNDAAWENPIIYGYASDSLNNGSLVSGTSGSFTTLSFADYYNIKDITNSGTSRKIIFSIYPKTQSSEAENTSPEYVGITGSYDGLRWYTDNNSTWTYFYGCTHEDPEFVYIINPKLKMTIAGSSETSEVTDDTGTYLSVDYGKDFTLTASRAAGTGTGEHLTYQWYRKNDSDNLGEAELIAGATEAVLHVDASELQSGNTYSYFIRALDGYGGDTGDPTTVDTSKCNYVKVKVGNANAPSITVTTSSSNFDDVAEGYSTRQTMTVTVTNNGTMPVKLTAGDISNFEIIDYAHKVAGKVLAAKGQQGNSLSFSIRPKSGLKYDGGDDGNSSYKTYSEDVKITATSTVNNASTTDRVFTPVIKVKPKMTLTQGTVTDMFTDATQTLKAGTDSTSTVQITGGITPYSYSWTYNGNVIGSDSSVVISQSQPGEYVYKLTVTDKNGASASCDISIGVSTKLEVQVSDTLGNNPTSYTPGGKSVTLKVVNQTGITADSGELNYSWYYCKSGAATDDDRSALQQISSGTKQTLSAAYLPSTAGVYEVYPRVVYKKQGDSYVYGDTGDPTVTVSNGGYSLSKLPSIKVTINDNSPKLTLSVPSDGTLKYSDVTVGYSDQEEKTVTIVNAGDLPIVVSAELYTSVENGTVSSCFESADFTDSVTLDSSGKAGSSFTFHIRVKKGVKSGTYSEKLYIQYENEGSTGNAPQTISLDASLNVVDAAKITLPTQQTVTAGKEITLSPKVEGGIADYSYEWDLDGVKVSSAQNYTFTPTDVGTYTYTLTVTDSCGVVSSADTKLIVNDVKYGLSLSRTEYSFTGALVGYTKLPNSLTVTLENTGEEDLTVIRPEPESYTIDGMDKKEALKSGASLDVTITPVKGLAAGNNIEEIVFKTNQSNVSAAIIVSFTVTALDESLKVEPGNISFTGTTEGYTTLPSAQKVTVTNVGNTAVSLEVPSAGSYTVTGISKNQSLAKDSSVTISVVPNKGLAAGNNEETIKIATSNGGQGSFTASFAVAKAPEIKVTGKTQTEIGVATALTADVSGGTQPYTYKWSDGSTSATISVSPEVDTEYTVKVTDAAGISCEGSAKVKVADKLSVSVDGGGTIQSGESAVLSTNVEGGVSPYTYSWNTTPVTTGSSATVSPEHTTVYTVTVQDSLGVTATASAVVRISETKEAEASADEKLGISDSIVSLGTATVGYDVSGYISGITLTNTGEKTYTIEHVGSTYFNVSGIDEDKEIAPGDKVYVSISPKDGLSIGEYSETLLFKTSLNATATTDAKFTVKSADVTESTIRKERVTDSKNYEYGSGNLTVTVENDSEESKIVIPDSKETVLNVLTEEEMQELADGSDIEVRVVTSSDVSNISQDDIDLINDAIVRYGADYPGLTAGLFMDIKLQKRIDDNSWESVSETTDPVEMELEIPDSLKDKADMFYLMRVHDGSCTKVAEWNAGDAKFPFSSSQYSTYCLAYTNAGASDTGNLSQNVDTFIHSGSTVYIIMAVLVAAIAVLAIIVAVRFGKKDDE